MPARVFISYRRADSIFAANMIKQALNEVLPPGNVFLDTGTIRPGMPFPQEIMDFIEVADIALALVGPNWNPRLEHDPSRRRLDDDGDLVRKEIWESLRRGVRVVPILLDGGKMPRKDELPDLLHELPELHAERILAASFDADMENLIAKLELGGPIAAGEELPGGARLVIGPHKRPLVAPLRFPHPKGIYAGLFAPAGDRIVTAGKDGAATVWSLGDVRAQQRGLVIARHLEALVWCAFSPDGQMVGTASEDDTAAVWLSGLADQRPLRIVRHTQNVTTVAFSPIDDGLVTGAWDGVIKLWDRRSGELRWSVDARDVQIGNKDDEPVINSACFSPDGTMVLTSCSDSNVLLLDSATGEVRGRFVGHEEGVCAANFSSDGTRIVTAGSEDFTAVMWDVASREALAVLRGDDDMRHRSTVWGASFSPDGNLVATASNDCTSLVWDIRSREIVARLEHPQPIYTAFFSPCSAKVLTACDDGDAYLWRIA